MSFIKGRIVLLSQRGDCGFAPTLNQAALLSEMGDVVALDAMTEAEVGRTFTPASVERVRIVRKSASSRSKEALARLDWLRQFVRAFKRQLQQKPDVVVAYDPKAACLLLRRTKSASLRVVHLHEMPLAEHVASSPVGRFALRSTMKHLHRADLVVMPFGRLRRLRCTRAILCRSWKRAQNRSSLRVWGRFSKCSRTIPALFLCRAMLQFLQDDEGTSQRRCAGTLGEK